MISEELINKCINNDRKAHKKVYNLCAPYVYTIIKSYISSGEYVKDAMQEVFAQIFISMDRYDGSKASFKTWITRITINNCLSILRKKDQLTYINDIEGLSELSTYTLDSLDRLTKKDIERMLEKMPNGYKIIFMLSVFDDYKHKEIAEILDISEVTSRSQLHRAIKWIKDNILHHPNNSFYESYL
jgi:RNA polymerase sigma-70 factor, ECF subfamily